MRYSSLFFTKSLTIATIATAFSLWLTGFISPKHEDILGYALILSIGILHGANDLKLLKKTIKTDLYNFWSILLKYILVVVAAGCSFFIAPSAALVIFIVLSSFHFGEQHWHVKEIKASMLNTLLFVCYGLLIFSLLFYLNATETHNVILGITGMSLELPAFKLFFITAFVLTAICAGVAYYKKTLHINIFEELFLIAVFFIVFNTASLIWGFAIYFIFWHSMPSLIDQIEILYGGTNGKSVRQYLKSSFIYWLSAIIGLCISIYGFRNYENLFLPVFFSFLAAITLPHVLVMHKIFHNK